MMMISQNLKGAALKKHQRWIDLLFGVSCDLTPVARARITAGLVYRNRIVSIGCNSYKTDPFQAKFQKNNHSIHLHAEVSAIKKFISHMDEKVLTKATLYVTRAKCDTKNHSNMIYGLAEPCDGCMKAICHYGISKIIYTSDGGIMKGII